MVSDKMMNCYTYYLGGDAELPSVRPILDVQEHLWLRKQSENRRIKFDIQRSLQQSRIFQRELDHKLIKLQREIRNIRSLQLFETYVSAKKQKPQLPTTKIPIPAASTQSLVRSVTFQTTSYKSNSNLNYKPNRPRSSKIVQEIIKSMNSLSFHFIF